MISVERPVPVYVAPFLSSSFTTASPTASSAVGDGVEAEALQPDVLHAQHPVDGLEGCVQRTGADGHVLQDLIAPLELDVGGVGHAVAGVDHMAQQLAGADEGVAPVEHQSLNIAAGDVLFLVRQILEPANTFSIS